MRAVILVAAVVLTSELPNKSVQPGGLSDLVIEDATIDLTPPENPRAPREPIVVRVRNEGQKTIVAWGVGAIVTDENGVAKRAGGGFDGFEYDLRSLPNSPVLRPHDSYTIRLTASPGFNPATVTASAEYVVFDDNTAAGVERSIEMVFERRARDAAAWQFTERALEEALASGAAPDDVLRLVEKKITAAPKDIVNTSAGFQVPQRIRIALRDAADATALIETLGVEAGIRARNAADRSIRRR